MNKALFWDFDGTLAVLKGRWSKQLESALDYCGHTIPFDKIKDHLRSGFTWQTPENAYIDHTGDKWWENLFAHFSTLYRRYDLDDGHQINNRMKEMILTPANYELYDDTISTLTRCGEAGFDQYILSNNYPELIAILKGLGIDHYFKKVIVSGLVGYEKPRKELFLHAQEMAGFPTCCYMIGDNPLADVQGGKAVGMKTILIHNDDPIDADHHCNTLTDVGCLLIP